MLSRNYLLKNVTDVSSPLRSGQFSSISLIRALGKHFCNIFLEAYACRNTLPIHIIAVSIHVNIQDSVVEWFCNYSTNKLQDLYEIVMQM